MNKNNIFFQKTLKNTYNEYVYTFDESYSFKTILEADLVQSTV